MKQCISRMKQLFIHLWQTLKEYVCRKKVIRKADTDGDGLDEIVLDFNGYPSENPQDIEHDSCYEKEE